MTTHTHTSTPPRLAGTDYDRLIERARSQRQALEPHRRAAALQAFSS